VPNTGSSAAVPGNGVDGPTCVQVTTISASPPHPATAAATGGSERQKPAVSATTPPSASSQARVGNEKNAHDGQSCVQDSDTANDATATAVSVTT
jgi:hypothetical protein